MIVSFGSLKVDMVFEVNRVPLAGQTVPNEGRRLEVGGKSANQAPAAARAGGWFIGFLAAAPDRRKPFEGAMRVASIAAGIRRATAGSHASIPSKDAIVAALERQSAETPTPLLTH